MTWHDLRNIKQQSYKDEEERDLTLTFTETPPSYRHLGEDASPLPQSEIHAMTLLPSYRNFRGQYFTIHTVKRRGTPRH